MKALQTVDAHTLISVPIQPVPFIVDRLLPPGVHILAGAPKVGKSWLMLQLCLSVARGSPLWGLPAGPRGVLYLCLEDTFARVQNRLFQITDEAPADLHFAIMAEQIGNGLVEQIQEFLTRQPGIGLIVVDTLQRVRGAAADNNAYANDYREFAELKALADRAKIALILVHHLRKMSDADPFQRVSGTTGLTGAADSIYVLERDKREDSTATLWITGRDIETQALHLRFEDFLWRLLSMEEMQAAAAPPTPDFIFRVVSFIEAQQHWTGSATQLLEAMGDEETPATIVTKLLNQHHAGALLEHGIRYDYKRTGKARHITLDRVTGDSDDSVSPGGE